MLRCALLALTILGSLITSAVGQPGDDASNKAKAKDLAAFQGDWRVDWIERDGEKIELDDDALYTIKGNKWLRGDREISSIEIDPSFTPKLLDLTRVVDDARKGVIMQGIYK